MTERLFGARQRFRRYRSAAQTPSRPGGTKETGRGLLLSELV
jgi:hypothetical protein